MTDDPHELSAEEAAFFGEPGAEIPMGPLEPVDAEPEEPFVAELAGEAGPGTAAADTTYLSEQEQQYLSDVGGMVADHEVRIERLEEKAKEPEKPRDWIARHQDRADWQELAAWVDWLNASYSMPDAARVPACWPAHPGLVHVLAGLRASWTNSVLADEQSEEKGNAMAAFHDYHLLPFFSRLQNPAWFPCVGSGHRPDEQHAVTDESYFPEDLKAPEEDAAEEEAVTREELKGQESAAADVDDAQAPGS